MVNVPYAGMVNIIAGSMIMPEILQSEVTVDCIYKMVKGIIYNPEKTTQMKSDLFIVQNLLKGRENTKTAAMYILDLSKNT